MYSILLQTILTKTKIIRFIPKLNPKQNNKNMFTSSKYDIDPLRSLVNEMSLNQNYDEPTNSYNEFQMSASESRAILQNIHQNNNREEYSFDSLNDQEFPTIEDSQNLLDRHKKVRNKKITRPCILI